MNLTFQYTWEYNMYDKTQIFCNCENLIAEEGSILFSSKQINKTNQTNYPNIIVFSKNQILAKKWWLSAIKKKYEEIILPILPQ
jgi:hypothetical protein